MERDIFRKVCADRRFAPRTQLGRLNPCLHLGVTRVSKMLLYTQTSVVAWCGSSEIRLLGLLIPTCPSSFFLLLSAKTIPPLNRQAETAGP